MNNTIFVMESLYVVWSGKSLVFIDCYFGGKNTIVQGLLPCTSYLQDYVNFPIIASNL